MIRALAGAILTSENVGVYAVELFAIDDVSKSFYLKYEFLSLQDHPRHLYLPVATIAKMIRPHLAP